MEGQVKTWKMTEEQRLAYIDKHPIVSTKKTKGKAAAFSNINTYGERAKNKKSQREREI